MPDLAKLRISFLAGTLGPGGSERQLYYLVSALRQAGASTRVLCLTQGEFWEDRIRQLGVPVTFVGQRGSRFARVARILAELRRHPADVFQSQHFYTNLYVVVAARALGIADVGAVRGDAASEVRVNGELAGRLSLWAPRVIAANSHRAICHAVRMGVPAAKFRFLPNVVDTDEFCPAARQDGGAVRLLAVGRLDRGKRFDRFLDALAGLREKARTALQATIVGSGPDGPRLRQQAKMLGLWPGIVEFRDVIVHMAPVYRESDILVSTSEREGTPNVLLEAMACGVPVVATSVGDVPEFIRDGETGLLVDSDSKKLVEALLRLIEDRTLRRDCGGRARDFVRSRYSLRSLPESLTALYGSLIS